MNNQRMFDHLAYYTAMLTRGEKPIYPLEPTPAEQIRKVGTIFRSIGERVTPEKHGKVFENLAEELIYNLELDQFGDAARNLTDFRNLAKEMGIL